MELTKSINNNISNDINLEKKQNGFLQSTLGKVINSGLNLGLRLLLPDFIENQVIEVKDTLFNEGLGEGIKKAISSAIDLGKNAIGVFTGNFESISQAQDALQKGGIIKGLSDAVDYSIEKTQNDGILSNNITNTIKNGKDTILSTISNKIENEFNKQLNSLEKIQKYSSNWKEYFNKKDFNSMTKELYKINSELKKILPMENIIKQARTIQNLHELIKNNGKDFNLSEEELKLAEMLS